MPTHAARTTVEVVEVVDDASGATGSVVSVGWPVLGIGWVELVELSIAMVEVANIKGTHGCVPWVVVIASSSVVVATISVVGVAKTELTGVVVCAAELDGIPGGIEVGGATVVASVDGGVELVDAGVSATVVAVPDSD